MNRDKSAKLHENSYTLVIAVAFVIAVLMPFVRAVVTGETEVAAAYATTAPAPSSAHAALAGSSADEFSILVVGAFLLGLGSVLRRVA